MKGFAELRLQDTEQRDAPGAEHPPRPGGTAVSPPLKAAPCALQNGFSWYQYFFVSPLSQYFF